MPDGFAPVATTLPLATAPATQAALRPGQVVSATVIAELNAGMVRIVIEAAAGSGATPRRPATASAPAPQGPTLDIHPPRPLPVGTTLTLAIERGGPAPRLAILDIALPPNTTQAPPTSQQGSQPPAQPTADQPGTAPQTAGMLPGRSAAVIADLAANAAKPASPAIQPGPSPQPPAAAVPTTTAPGRSNVPPPRTDGLAPRAAPGPLPAPTPTAVPAAPGSAASRMPPAAAPAPPPSAAGAAPVQTAATAVMAQTLLATPATATQPPLPAAPPATPAAGAGTPAASPPGASSPVAPQPGPPPTPPVAGATSSVPPPSTAMTTSATPATPAPSASSLPSATPRPVALALQAYAGSSSGSPPAAPLSEAAERLRAVGLGALLPAMRSAGERQAGLAPLFADAAAALSKPDRLPADIRAVLTEVVGRALPDPAKIAIDADAIRAAFVAVGLVPPRPADPVRPSLDKTLALLKGLLGVWLGDDSAAPLPDRPPPPGRGPTPRPEPEHAASLPPDASETAVARRLLAEVDGAASRRLLHQLAAVPDPQEARETGGPRLQHGFEIPFPWQGRMATLAFEVSRDGGQANAEASERAWQVRFSLDVEPLGPVHVLLRLKRGTGGVTLWAEEEETLGRLRAQSDELKETLAASGIALDALTIQPGHPVFRRAASGVFVDWAT